MPRVSVSLRVFGESLEPDEVSALLGCQPSRWQRKGDSLDDGPTARLAETGAWILDSELSHDSDIESHVESILARLTADPDEWANLTALHSADLSCGMWVDRGGSSFEISPRLSGALAERGLVIGFDVSGRGSGPSTA